MSTAASATRCGSATSPPARIATRSPARRRGAASPGRPATTGCSTPGPTTRCARTRSGATASARRRPTTSSSTARTTSGSSSRSRRRAAGAGSSSPRRRRRAASRFVLAADDPEGDAAHSSGRGRRDVEYGIDDWGDRFVVLTNLDAPDFRLMTAPHDDPGAWSDLVAHEAGRRLTEAEPFADHLVVHEWMAAQPRVRVLRRDGTSEVLDFGDEPHDLALGANPEWDDDDAAAVVPVADDPAVGVRPRPRHRRARAAQADPDAGRRPRRLRRRAHVGDRRRRRRRPGRRRPPPRHPPRRHGAVRRLRLRRLRVLAGAVVQRRPPLAARPRRRLRPRPSRAAAASSAGRGTSTASCSTSATRSPTRSPPATTSSPPSIADGARLALRGGSAGGLLVGACITMRPERFAAAVAEVPFVDVVTTMSDPSLPLTVTEWEEWGDPRAEPFASYIAGYSPYDNTVAADYPAIFVTAGLNDPRVSLPRAGEVGRPAALGRRRRRRGRSSCARRWAPATAAAAGATTPGATRPASSPSSSPNCTR